MTADHPDADHEPKWRYDVTWHLWDDALGGDGNRDAVRKNMNAMGAAGWELVSGVTAPYVHTFQAPGQIWFFMYWKKPA